MSKYKPEELPDFPAIQDALFQAGEAARQLGQRLTFHPSGANACGAKRYACVCACVRACVSVLTQACSLISYIIVPGVRLSHSVAYSVAHSLAVWPIVWLCGP